MEDKLKDIFASAIKKSNKLQFPCFIKDCKNIAINSHSQSLSNALINISTDGHLVAPRLDFFQIIKSNSNINSCFPKIGVNKASTFKGFCRHHDQEYFKTVDNIILDNIIDKPTLTKLAFRTFAYEERAKEKALFFYDYIIKNAYNLGDVSLMQHSAMGIRNHLQVTRPYYLNKFIKMFESQNYEQIHATIFVLKKLIPLSSSTAIDSTMTASNDLMKDNLSKPLNIAFFNLIPQSNSSLVCFVYFQNQREKVPKFIANIKTLENIIFNYCEETFMSIDFYNSLSSDIKYKIVMGLRGWAFWEKEEFPNLFNTKLESPMYI